MKNFLFLQSFFLVISFSVIGQTGKVYDDLSMTSSILNGERKFAIYLPPDYETSHRSYPVLYLLHGSGDDQTGWIQFGEVLRIADKAILEGTATPMIIVMPDAYTGQRGYFNNIKGDWRYEDFFFAEFLPYVEKTFRIKGEKRYRAVAGLSMGGGGSFIYALHHPELFSSACPLSAYIGPSSVEEFKIGKINILGATSIAEEGLDIPEVDSVIFYEPIPSAIRHIQRRGRTGRQEKGKVIILVTKDTRDEGYRWSAHHKEKRMHRILKDLKKRFQTVFSSMIFS